MCLYSSVYFRTWRNYTCIYWRFSLCIHIYIYFMIIIYSYIHINVQTYWAHLFFALFTERSMRNTIDWLFTMRNQIINELYIISSLNVWSHTRHYEWAKQTKFLLAVKYRSPGWHSNSSKTLRKIRKKLLNIFIFMLGPSESFKTKIWADPARPDLTRP